MSRYLSFHEYFYNLFNRKILKLPIDAGFTCPNRDGKISSRGCLFCSERGAGDFTSSSDLDIKTQMKIQRDRLKRKWPDGLNIAYFQNYTSTYKSFDELRDIYYEALSFEDTVGLAIATRADCIDSEIMHLLKELNEKTFLWVELGMQTVNDDTIRLINRGYEHEIFDSTVKILKENNIRTLAHIIFGLPGEEEEDMMNSIEYVNKMELFGVKIHNLYIQEDAEIANYLNKIKLLTKEEYVDLCVKAIANLNPEIVIHRLTGDPDRKKLLEPKWVCNKLGVISSINKKLKDDNITQGINFAKKGK
ncbi:MAG: TIGR01212 family radical SAM protein [Tissierellia bacterium]|nr:TIGR01212 family radical SAM protein [Tissierellia bacterium]